MKSITLIAILFFSSIVQAKDVEVKFREACNWSPGVRSALLLVPMKDMKSQKERIDYYIVKLYCELNKFCYVIHIEQGSDSLAGLFDVRSLIPSQMKIDNYSQNRVDLSYSDPKIRISLTERNISMSIENDVTYYEGTAQCPQN